MQSLRDIGYDFSSAVADIIDNSIAAGATKVWVDYEFEGADTWIRIADNGSGMRPEVMDEALRFGTRRDYDDLALGKFGLGLKTASISQCQRLTVASRVLGGRIAIRAWDLQHIEKTDSWELLCPSTSECHKEAVAPLRKGTGTVVFWQRLERILGYQVPAGKAAQNGFIRMVKELEEHLAMVFHRFLTGEAQRGRPLSIYINGHEVEPWDPFCRSEAYTQELPSHELEFEHEGVRSQIRVRPYVLPHESQFSSGRAFRRAGRGQWNALQGFYIYRNDRLLQAGGWNRIRSLDEHVKLARIAVDFPPSADVAFRLNVTKMGISFPAEVRERLAKIVRDTTRRAQEVYRNTGSSFRSFGNSSVNEGELRPSKTGAQAKDGGAGKTAKPDRRDDSELRGGAPTQGASDLARPKREMTTGSSESGKTVAPPLEPVETAPNPELALAQKVLSVLKCELKDDPVRLKRIVAALAVVAPEFAAVAGLPSQQEAVV